MSHAWRRRCSALLPVVLTMTFACPPALAQSAPPKAPTQQDIDEARKHYEQGLKLFNEEAYEAALAEFERAYQLAPSYRILYNTGKIYRARNDFVSAMRNFERYLAEGKGEVPTERRVEVEKYIQDLNSRVARVEVATSLKDADVAVDDVSEGKTPLPRSLVVNPGRRKITVSKSGYAPASQVVNVVAGDSIRVALEPTSLTVRIEPTKDTSRGTWLTVGWISTGVLAAGAVSFGLLARKASNDLQNDLNQPGQARPDLDSQRSKMRTFDVLADVLAVSALGVGGVTLYFTLKKPKEQSSPPPSAINVRLGPGSAYVTGSF